MSRNFYKNPNRKGNQMQFVTVPKAKLGKARLDRYQKTLKETGDMFYSLVKSFEIDIKTDKKSK